MLFSLFFQTLRLRAEAAQITVPPAANQGPKLLLVPATMEMRPATSAKAPYGMAMQKSWSTAWPFEGTGGSTGTLEAVGLDSADAVT